MWQIHDREYFPQLIKSDNFKLVVYFYLKLISEILSSEIFFFNARARVHDFFSNRKVKLVKVSTHEINIYLFYLVVIHILTFFV